MNQDFFRLLKTGFAILSVIFLGILFATHKKILQK